MKTIAIYRNQLFKLSETFIANQALSIKNFEVEFIGREAINTPPPSAYTVFTSVTKKGGYSTTLAKAYQAITMCQSKLVSATKHHRPDLVHAHFAVDALYALMYTKKINVPLVSTLHGFDVTTSRKNLLMSTSPAWINYALFSKRLKRDGNCFLCVSEFIRSKAIEAGFDEKKLITHRIGIDINKYKTDADTRKERVIIHVGRLVEKKGTEILIDAINRIKDKLQGFQLHIIGDGPQRKKLSAKIHNLELGEHIKMLGELPHADVMHKIKNSAFAVVPSIEARSGDSEGLPTVIMEAAALSLPVIGTYHAGIPEAIIDDVTGYLIKPRDPDALAERILALIESDDLIADLGASGRLLMEREFNLFSQTEKLEKIYSSFI